MVGCPGDVLPGSNTGRTCSPGIFNSIDRQYVAGTFGGKSMCGDRSGMIICFDSASVVVVIFCWVVSTRDASTGCGNTARLHHSPSNRVLTQLPSTRSDRTVGCPSNVRCGCHQQRIIRAGVAITIDVQRVTVIFGREAYSRDAPKVQWYADGTLLMVFVRHWIVRAGYASLRIQNTSP